MNNIQRAFKKKGTCGLADGGRPNPNMLGTGAAANAGHLLAGRGRQIEGALGAATGGAPAPTPAAPPSRAGGLSARRDNAMPPAHMLAARDRGMADGGKPKRKPNGGEVEGPGGPTDDEAGVYALSDEEYVLPADTVEAMGGAEVLDQIRDETHEFVDEDNRPRGLANGGLGGAYDWMKGKVGSGLQAGKDALSSLRGQPAAPQVSMKTSAGGFTNAERMASAARANPVGSPLPSAAPAPATAYRGGPQPFAGEPKGRAAQAAQKATRAASMDMDAARRASAVRPPPVAPAPPVAGGLAQPPSKAMSRFTTAVKGGGVLAGMDQLGRGVAGIMEPGDSSTGDKIRAGVGAASFIPGLAQGARPIAGGMSLANMIPDSVYEKGLGMLGLMPEESGVQLGPEAQKMLDAVGAKDAAEYNAMREQSAPAPAPAGTASGARPGQGAQAAPVARPAPPDYGNDSGTGFIINHQTGKRTNIDSRAGLGYGLGAGREAAPQGGMTQELAGRARQYNTDADALMSKQGGGIGEAFVARGMRNSANGLNTQAMTSQGLDDARENQQLKREGDERVGLAKARADMAKAQQDQKNSDRTFGLAQNADTRAGGKQRRDEVQRALEGKLGKQFDKDGNLSPAWMNTEAALRNTLQGRTNPDGTPMTMDTLPDQELEQLTQTLGLSQKGELKNWRKTLNWLMGDSKPSSNEIESGLRPAANSASKSWLGGYTWKDQDGREKFSDDLTYDEQIALGIRPERAQ